MYEDNKWEIKDNYIFISLGEILKKINSSITINDKIKILNQNEIQITIYILGYIPLNFKAKTIKDEKDEKDEL